MTTRTTYDTEPILSEGEQKSILAGGKPYTKDNRNDWI